VRLHRSRRSIWPRVILVLGLFALATLGTTYSAFSGTTSNPSNSFTAAPDFAPPTATAVLAKSTGYSTGSIKQGGTYYVYANFTDTGNPASGFSSATADVHTITTGQTSVAFSSGSFSAAGTSYSYRTAQLTANNPLAAGTYNFTITSTDVAGNSGTQTLSATVDNTGPTGSDVQATNVSGGTVGKAEIGDTITITYSEAIDPDSIVSGWNGSSTNMGVLLSNGGGPNNDAISFWNSAFTVQLPLGSINLGRQDYTTGTVAFGFSGTPSTMVVSGNSITITLGTASAADTIAAGTGTMSWTPSATATDLAGNACSTTTVNESGAADKEF
jgi:Bacterial Ig-like domain